MVGKSTNPLDLFHLLLEQRILVCRPCKAGVTPRHLVTHIRAHHRGLHSKFQTKQSAIEWVQDRLLPSLPCALLDPAAESIPVPLADAKAFPVLKIHVGYSCTYCPAVSKREDEIRKHYNACHTAVRRGRGGAVANSRGMMQKRLNHEHYSDQPAYLPAFYQRFFTAGVKDSTCFRVTAPEKPTQGATSPGQGSLPRSDEGQFVMDQIFGTLARLETTQSHVERIPGAALTKTQVSPWLERRCFRCPGVSPSVHSSDRTTYQEPVSTIQPLRR